MLDGKTIVVTGAANGIGAEVAKQARQWGATVIGLDIAEAEHVDRFIQTDLSCVDSIANAAEAIDDGIDGLANIAGLPPTAGRLPVLSVNFIGLRTLTEALIGKFNDGASVINLGSLAGSGWPERTTKIKSFIERSNFENVDDLCDELDIGDADSYFFAKETLICWTMLNRWTWRDRDIRMNAISPGPVETRILPDFIKTLGERAEEDMKIMDRPGNTKDIAPVVAFMLSDEAKWFRGANLPLDGGMFSHISVNMHGLD